MPTAVYTVTASCSIEDAFDYVADVARHPEWASDEMRVELLTPGVTGVGARYRTIGHSEVWHTDNVAEVEVTRHERPAAYEIVCTDSHGQFRHLFTFAQQPDGSVRIERHYTVPDALSEEARRRVEELMPTVIEPSRRGAMARLGQLLDATAASRA